MPRPIGELSGNGIIAEMRAELRRLWRAVGSNQAPVGEYNEYTLASSTDSAHTLTYIPGLSLIPIAFLNGLAGRYGTDYTVDFTTGIVTWSATKVAGDILSVFYQTTGDLVALSGPADTGTISDTFDRADNTTNPNPASDGGTWTSLNWPWGINTNRLYVSSAISNTWSVGGSASAAAGPGGNLSTAGVIGRDLTSAAQDLTATLYSNSSGNPHGYIYLNFDPTVRSAYWIDLHAAGGIWRAPGNANASATKIGTLSIGTSWPNSGTLVRAHHDGAGNISVYVAGSLVGSATDSTPLTGTWVCLSLDAASPGSPPIPSWDSFTANAS